MRFSLIFAALLYFNCSLSKQPELEIRSINNGVLNVEKIPIDIVTKDGNIISSEVESFAVMEDTLRTLMDPWDNRDHLCSHTNNLNFTKKITYNSPEYYLLFSVYHIEKSVEYFKNIFNNETEFKDNFKDITITIAGGNIDNHSDYSPEYYIYSRMDSITSPNIPYYETTRRALREIQGKKGFEKSYSEYNNVFEALLSYYTASLNNSPKIRYTKSDRNNADISELYFHPKVNALKVDSLRNAWESSVSVENMSEVFQMNYALINILEADYKQNPENYHPADLTLASTLWRIRIQLGKELTDKMIANTYLNLKEYLEQRNNYYIAYSKEMSPKPDWYDLFFGLIDQDKIMNEGKYSETIINEFKTSRYPLALIRL